MFPQSTLVLGSRLRVALVVAGALSILFACTKQDVKPAKQCTAGDYVFCRCQDRQEGEALCNADGSQGACEPCETIDNPTGPLQPGDPGYPGDDGGVDGGVDASTEKPELCGNGTVDDGEDCDDGNSDDTDGCDATCKLAGLTPAATSACPGLTVHLWGGAQQPSLVTMTTGSGLRSASPACTTGTSTSGASAPDRIFKVVPHKAGTLTVTTTDANYDSFIYVATSCSGSANVWLACANNNGAAAGESLALSVDAGKAYYVFIDGAGSGAGANGTARVTFSLP